MIATKDQERAALVKIRKIVRDLGEDSYVGTAFDGAFELAEENIENDAAFSCQGYIDTCHRLQRKAGNPSNICSSCACAYHRDDDLFDCLAGHGGNCQNTTCEDYFSHNDAARKLRGMQCEMDDLRKMEAQAIQSADSMQSVIDDLEDKYIAARDTLDKREHEAEEAEAALTVAQLENIRLKAKLYDMMTAQA